MGATDGIAPRSVLRCLTEGCRRGGAGVPIGDWRLRHEAGTVGAGYDEGPCPPHAMALRWERGRRWERRFRWTRRLAMFIALLTTPATHLLLIPQVVPETEAVHFLGGVLVA